MSKEFTELTEGENDVIAFASVSLLAALGAVWYFFNFGFALLILALTCAIMALVRYRRKG